MKSHYWAAFAVLLAACGESSSKAPAPPPPKGAQDSGKAGAAGGEGAGANDPEEGGGQPAPDQLLGPDASFLRAKYGLSLRAAGINACLGEIIIRVKASPPKEGSGSSGLFEIQDGIVKCPGFGTFNLKEMLGAFQDQAPKPDVKNPVVVEDNVISMKVLQQGTYDPPRPLIPSFIAASPEELKGLDVTKTVKLTDSKANTESSGTVQVKTLGLDGWKPPKLDREFPRVLHFQVTNEGFSGADKIGNFIFDKMEFRISLDPIAILSISFDGKASDYTAALANLPAGGGDGKEGADGKEGGGGLEQILGGGGKDNPLGGVISAFTKVIKIKLEMDLLDQQNLDETKTEEPTSDGPVIGS
jgi:hypothetical protein